MVETEVKGYFITEDGRVWSSKRKIFLKTWENHNGYLKVNIGNKQVFVHRLVAKAYVGNGSSKPFVNHIDGNKKNNHYSNLEWVTASENSKHAFDNDLLPNTFESGENHPNSKISTEDVVEIKKRIEQGEMLKNIAKDFSVTPQALSDIKRGKSWSHIGADGIVR